MKRTAMRSPRPRTLRATPPVSAGLHPGYGLPLRFDRQQPTGSALSADCASSRLREDALCPPAPDCRRSGRRLALPVVQLGHAGHPAHTIVRIGLVVAAADRAQDLLRAGVLPWRAGAGLVALAADARPKLAERAERTLDGHDAPAGLSLWFRRGVRAGNEQ